MGRVFTVLCLVTFTRSLSTTKERGPLQRAQLDLLVTLENAATFFLASALYYVCVLH
jgi:hypothetical protein